MDMTRRGAIGLGLAAATAPLAAGAAQPQAKQAIDASTAMRPVKVPVPRTFTADWASFAAGDDWYGRQMYLQGHPTYEHRLKHYGHPADIGFMEMQNLWKAEKWDPARLIDLYQKAGARYFMALTNHHDTFDCYDSAHHPWNSTRIGPKKDIVGIWAKRTRERGLRFGVSNHSAHAWHWNQYAYGYDIEGPRRGQRYDAAKLTRADGHGKTAGVSKPSSPPRKRRRSGAWGWSTMSSAAARPISSSFPGRPILASATGSMAKAITRTTAIRPRPRSCTLCAMSCRRTAI